MNTKIKGTFSDSKNIFTVTMDSIITWFFLLSVLMSKIMIILWEAISNAEYDCELIQVLHLDIHDLFLYSVQ